LFLEAGHVLENKFMNLRALSMFWAYIVTTHCNV
jgi:hypothetical protein